MLSTQNISNLGIGGWGIGGFATKDDGIDEEKQIDAIVHALQKGLNFIEINFWNSEGKSVEIIKKAIDRSGKKREELFLCLVIYKYNNPTLVDVEKEIERFFATFQTTYIDTLEFPLSGIYTYGFDSVISLVSKYLTSNQTRYVSLTNSNLEYLKKYKDIFQEKFFSHELHYSFEVRDNEHWGIIDFASKNNITNVLYQPLRRNRTAQRNWPLLVELSEKYNKTQNQIILNWLVSNGFLPLVKSDNKAHIDENIDSLSFTMESIDRDSLNAFCIPHYQFIDIDWFQIGKGTPIHALPNSFDEMYP